MQLRCIFNTSFSFNKMVDLETKDWRYTWYSGAGGACWATYTWYIGGSQWEALLQFLVGTGLGFTATYLHNEWV